MRRLVPFALLLALPSMLGSAVLVFLPVLMGRPITPFVPRGLQRVSDYQFGLCSY